MQTDTPYKAAVVGLGNIGMGYDLNGEDRTTTHARAFEKHAGFELVGGVDANQDRRNLFSEKYSVQAYESVAALFEEKKVDIVALALPTEAHSEVFKALVEYPIDGVICEKPIATSASEGREMLSLAKIHEIHLQINYIRPYEPHTRRLMLELESQKYGVVRKSMVRYCGGLANNASHYINLFIEYFGMPGELKVLQIGDVNKTDPEPDFYLSWGDFVAYFFAFDSGNYNISELDVYCDGGAIRYRDRGTIIERLHITEDSDFSDYKKLTKKDEINTELMQYQWYCLDHFYTQLQGSQRQLECGYLNVEKACQTLSIVEEIMYQIKHEKMANER